MPDRTRTKNNLACPNSNKDEVGTASENETRLRLIQVATYLFASHGFDGVSIRKITGEANVNLGAVNYHFGSKNGLIRAVFQSLARPVNDARLSELDAYEKKVGDGQPQLNHVSQALVAPAIRFTADPETGGFYLFRLLALARALPNSVVSSVIADEYDVIFDRFVAAIERAMPHLSKSTIAWRYSFAIGSLLHVIGYFDGNERLKRLSNGFCDVNDVDVLIDHLVEFVTAGLRGEAMALPREKK